MWKFPSMWNVADLGKILMMKTKKWLETFLSRSDISYTNSERKDHVYVAKIVGKRRYKHGVITFVFIVEFVRSSGHYKGYRESRCHRYILLEFQEITSIISTIWFREISQSILLQSKYSTQIIFIGNMWKLCLACKGTKY